MSVCTGCGNKFTSEPVTEGRPDTIGRNTMQRLKIFHVDERAILEFLQCWRGNEFLMLPTAPQIPPGARLVRLWHDNAWRALCVLVEHESFPEVPDGMEAPREPNFIMVEALERIPVADKFRYPIHDPSKICLHCQWFYQSKAIRRFQIDNPRKMCQGECRQPGHRYGTGNESSCFAKTFADGYCSGFLRLEYPLPYPSAFPVPKITALERWLTVANIEKYTAETDIAAAWEYCREEELPNEMQVPPDDSNKLLEHFRKRGEEIATARTNAAIKAIEGK